VKNNVKGGTIIFPNTTTLGNVEVNNRITAAFQATVKTLNAAGKLKDFKVDAGPNNIGIDVDKDNIVNSIVNLIESRKDVVGAFAANGFVTPALGDAIAQLKKNGSICAFGFDLGPKQQEQIRTGALTGSLGQQPFLQGFWPVAQLYLQLDRGISAANLDTRAQLVTKDSVGKVGKRFEN
jgi:simple sugar transport system substrate-binding protein